MQKIGEEMAKNAPAEAPKPEEPKEEGTEGDNIKDVETK
jgi:hypothetical protein